MSVQVFAKVVIRRSDGCVLVLKRSDDDALRPSEWDLPGGGVEKRESSNEGAAREVMEETSLRVDPKALTLLYAATSYFAPTGDSNTRILFYTSVNDTNLSEGVKLSHEHSEYKWQPLEEALAEHPHPVYRAGLRYALDHDLLA